MCFIHLLHSSFHTHNHFMLYIKYMNHHDKFHRHSGMYNSKISIEQCLKYNLDNYIIINFFFELCCLSGFQYEMAFATIQVIYRRL